LRKSEGDIFDWREQARHFLVRKDLWDAINVFESFRGTCWIVAGRLLASIDQGVNIAYLSEKLLYKRGGNDSFLDRGVINRCRIGIEAFQHVGDVIFGRDSEAAFHIRRVLRFDISIKMLLIAKLRAAQNPVLEDISTLDRIVALHYSDPGLRNSFYREIYRSVPVRALALASWLKGRFRR
jgi:abequosyltransferase